MSKKSLEAFQALLENDERTSTAKRIVEKLKKGVMTIDLLCTALNKRYSTITGRLSELNEIGMVKYISSSGSQSVIAYVSNESEREQIRKTVKAEQKAAWVKRGEREGWIESCKNA
jgi:predicted transcriptional regulator